MCPISMRVTNAFLTQFKPNPKPEANICNNPFSFNLIGSMFFPAFLLFVGSSNVGRGISMSLGAASVDYGHSIRGFKTLKNTHSRFRDKGHTYACHANLGIIVNSPKMSDMTMTKKKDATNRLTRADCLMRDEGSNTVLPLIIAR